MKYSLLPEKYDEIKECVINNFEEYGINSTPVNAFEFAKKLEIKLVPYSKLTKEQLKLTEKFTEEGFTLFDNNKAIIYYNDFCKSSKRMQHTIMHEIGHYLLGHKKQGEEEEIEANFCASYALAPTPLIPILIKQPNFLDIMFVFNRCEQAAERDFKSYLNWKKINNKYGYKPFEKRLINLFTQNNKELTMKQ